jgi:hypothetical protein
VNVVSRLDGSWYGGVAVLNLRLYCLNMIFGHPQQASLIGGVVFDGAFEKDVLAAWESDINGRGFPDCASYPGLMVHDTTVLLHTGDVCSA